MERVKTIASEELLMKQFDSHDWEELWLKLMGRCYWLLRNRYSIDWGYDERKEFSRKIISEVIEKIFVEKERKWNTDRYPDFEEFIISVIDSHVNNTLNKKNKKYNVGNNEFIFDENGESEPGAQEIIMTEELRNQ